MKICLMGLDYMKDVFFAKIKQICGIGELINQFVIVVLKFIKYQNYLNAHQITNHPPKKNIKMNINEAKDKSAQEFGYSHFMHAIECTMDERSLNLIVDGAMKLYAKEANDKANRLQKFKNYVHKRLDQVGVPHDPEPTKNKEHGCRIEGRLNFILQWIKLIDKIITKTK